MEGRKLMPTIDNLEWTFDKVPELYAKIRPSYPTELYESIFDYLNVDDNSKLIEIGIGGGQATPPFLNSGCELTAIEYGENLSELCREKFKDYPKFKVITGKFEDVNIPENTYDLIYSASAFHWVPEELGYTKVYNSLLNGGVFARFANHPFRCKNEPELSKAIDEIYEQYYYSYYDNAPAAPSEYTENDAKLRSDIALKYGFKDVTYKLFNRIREFSAQEYIQLLGTYSDHIAIESSIREKFFNEIEKAIEAYGDTIKLYDTLDLQLARK